MSLLLLFYLLRFLFVGLYLLKWLLFLLANNVTNQREGETNTQSPPPPTCDPQEKRKLEEVLKQKHLS